MAAYYFDASALVKRYVGENGTVWVRGIASPNAGHLLFVSLISGAEVVAAISKRGRMGSLTSVDARQAISDFQSHFQAQYGIIGLTHATIGSAMLLAPKHSLRGYDSVQLATALALSDEMRTLGSGPMTVVSADAELNNAAGLEGLVVEDPRSHADPLDLIP